jgi:hypothetical protein
MKLLNVLCMSGGNSLVSVSLLHVNSLVNVYRVCIPVHMKNLSEYEELYGHVYGEVLLQVDLTHVLNMWHPAHSSQSDIMFTNTRLV